MPIRRMASGWTCRCLLVLAAVLVVADARAQSDSVSTEFDAAFTFYPAPVWSRSSGFSVGAGYELENAVLPHDRFLAVAKPGQHRGRYSITYFAGDRTLQPFYAVVQGYYETAGRHWYYGTGPASSVDDQIAVEKTRSEVSIHAGVQPFGRRVFIQPEWGIYRHVVRDFRDWDDGAFERLSDLSRTRLELFAESVGLPLSSTPQEGQVFGLAAGIDLRDRPVRPRRGLLVQGAVRRHRLDNPEDLRFDRYELGSYVYLPIGSNILALRALLQMTELVEERPLPFYLLPVLDGEMLPGYALYRFVGPDLFAVSAEVAMTLFQLFDFAAMDLLVSAGVGSVYEDISEQFELGVSFDGSVSRDHETVPLRPSVGLGFALQSLRPNGWDVRVLLGWSPEGVRLVKFGFVHDLQAVSTLRR